MGLRIVKDMKVTSAQYFKDGDNAHNAGIKATIDGAEMFIPLDPANRHYAELMKLVEEDKITIEEVTEG